MKIAEFHDDGSWTCNLCTRRFNTPVLGLPQKQLAIHALSHLRREFNLLPEKADKLHALLTVLIEGW